MKLKNQTRIIIADSEKFLVLNNQGDESIMDLRIEDYMQRGENPPTREQGTDRPGRFPTPHGQVSAVRETDWHRLEKEDAAIELSGIINSIAADSDVTNIVLVSDPKTMGRIRPKLSTLTETKIVSELTKNLSKHPLADIEQLLRAA